MGWDVMGCDVMRSWLSNVCTVFGVSPVMHALLIADMPVTACVMLHLHCRVA